MPKLTQWNKLNKIQKYLFQNISPHLQKDFEVGLKSNVVYMYFPTIKGRVPASFVAFISTAGVILKLRLV